MAIYRTIQNIVSSLPSYFKRLFPPFVTTNKQATADKLLIKSTELFDENWYISSTGIDLNIDPVAHFLEHGTNQSPSEQFDSIWYLREYPDVAAAEINPLVHYLKYGHAEGRLTKAPDSFVEEIAQNFDPVWYLQQYPDVRQAEVDPLSHYLKYGREEGRLPSQCLSPAFDMHLWSGLENVALSRLTLLLKDSRADSNEKRYASWALARWYASKGNWAQTYTLLWTYQNLHSPFPYQLGVIILASQAAYKRRELKEAEDLISYWLKRKNHHPDLCLAMANILSNETDTSKKLAWINRIFENAGLLPVQLRDPQDILHLDNLSVHSDPEHRTALSPRVSVIVTAFNAESTIATAVNSLFGQTWRSLELIIVDDASTDSTWAHLQTLKLECPEDIHLTLIKNNENMGAYRSRNKALNAASGAFITCHDSDDWSHPQKIATQVNALKLAPETMATTSHWVRATPNLHFQHWRIESGLIERNMSSLMFRRTVFAELGYWDEVSVAADTEYYFRLFSAYGEHAVLDVLPGIPLSFGRESANSLTKGKQTHESSQLHGSRKDYMNAVHAWHERTEHLYIAENSRQRPFYAPNEIACSKAELNSSALVDMLLESGEFNSIWYRYRYSFLLDRNADPFKHYLDAEHNIEFDPGPDFSSSGYAMRYELSEDEHPLHHYLTTGKRLNCEGVPIITGLGPKKDSRKTIMLCGHQALSEVYGAERCLLEILQALVELNFSVVVVLPEIHNKDYFDKIKNLATSVAIVPCCWWMRDRPVFDETVRHFTRLIRELDVELVYINTSVLLEPAIAARKQAVPVVIHVHEVTAKDEEAQRLLNCQGDQVAEHICEIADCIISNSRFVTEYLSGVQSKLKRNGTDCLPPIREVPNTVDMAELLKLDIPIYQRRTGRPIAVGIISSNQPKKGLADFVELARYFERTRSPLEFKIFGPGSPLVDQLFPIDTDCSERCPRTPLGLSYEGYASHPIHALREIDILVNLSHCEESFGRTVLEAMAAGRVVFCYEWGALPELVVDGETGILCPYQQVHSVASEINKLIEQPESLEEMAQAGRERALNVYGVQAFKEKLGAAVSSVLT